MNILTVIVLAFIVISSIIGMKRGLIKTIFSLFSVVIALLLTAVFNPVVSSGLQNNENIIVPISESIEAVFFSDDEQTENSVEQHDFLEELEIPEKLKELIRDNNTIDSYDLLNADSFKKYVCNYFACMVISALSFVILFVVFMILLAVISTSLNLISKLPVLNGVNHLFGLAAGFAFSMVIVWIMCVALTALTSTVFGSNMMAQVGESEILSFIYNHNLLINKVTDVF